MLYLSTSFSEISGMYFCRILTCAPIKIPLYNSPKPYIMFLITSLWRPLQNKNKQRLNIQYHLPFNNQTEIRWFLKFNLFKIQFQATTQLSCTWMRVHLQSLGYWSRTLCNPPSWRRGPRWGRAKYFHPSAGWSEPQGKGNVGQEPTHAFHRNKIKEQ